MEEINEQQKNEIIRKRQDMFKKMGVSNAGKINENVVNPRAAASGIAAKLAAIKNGGAREELNKYISASGKSAGSGNGFQMPEPKKRTNPNQKKDEVKPEYKQELAEFSAPQSSGGQELANIEALFGGGGGSSSRMSPSPIPTEIGDDSFKSVPTFNPHAAQQKIREKAAQAAQAQGQPNPYLKFASDTLPMQNEEFVESRAIMPQGGQLNVTMMQAMMETIAKGIAEKTIKNVLSEYSEQQKGKTYFEYYNREKGIIKTPDGKYYRLTQVELKKKA